MSKKNIFIFLFILMATFIFKGPLLAKDTSLSIQDCHLSEQISSHSSAQTAPEKSRKIMEHQESHGLFEECTDHEKKVKPVFSKGPVGLSPPNAYHSALVVFSLPIVYPQKNPYHRFFLNAPIHAPPYIRL
ncbi:hypothetical protein AAG747_06960 [Rapidithrix thailandica]|uniref:Uncharacterized protein n=1 Tax=Rapidithrix thailandica TaxID=413964 RepID=A0AAW9S5L1_9BACT